MLHLSPRSLCGWFSLCPESKTLIITSKGNAISKMWHLCEQLAVHVCAFMHESECVCVGGGVDAEEV